MNVNISLRTFLVFAFGFFLVWILWNISGIILTFFLSFILFSTLKPIVDRLEDLGWKRGVAITFIYLTFVFVLMFAFYFIVNQTFVQAKNFLVNLNLNQEYIISQVSSISPNLGSQLSFLLENLQVALSDPSFLSSLSSSEYLGAVISSLSIVGGQGFRLLGGFFGGLFSVFVVLFLSIYMVLPRKNFYLSVLRLIPKKFEEALIPILEKIQMGLGSWVVGMIVLMLFVGLSTYLIILLPSFFISDYKLAQLAFLIALIAGILEAVPNIGPLLTYLITILFAVLLGSPFGVLVYISVSFFLLQQAEALFLVPTVMKKAIDVHPIVSILAVIIGFDLTGSPIGALLSIPVAGTLQIITLEVLKYWRSLDTNESSYL
ncbi:AI-2E family transporter [Candidatus Dojkabacteria bacterium]|uniref:AI-2E family transporter n=1 Tax=Candidatus Dojkabacteria bacterium TaxID=2099670 RepID=A0A3M0Z280_9BACT|nr:MAG: AI-2E family transporter [Candidatus Dojkabacteria bacterium]